MFVFIRVLCVPNSYHEILLEASEKKNAAIRTIINYFEQDTDNVHDVELIPPLTACPQHITMYSLPELCIRGIGLAVAAIGFAIGMSFVISGKKFGK
jgi:hypothetical protein